MPNTEKKWVLFLIEKMDKEEITVKIKKSYLMSGDMVKHLVDLLPEMDKANEEQ